MCKWLPRSTVFGFLNENILPETLRQGSRWESERHRDQQTFLSSPLLPPSRLGRLGNYIIWRWNESTLQAKVSEMLYCLWNCQLKSNTWNTQLKQPPPPMQGPNRSGPQRMFFFPSLTLSLLVKRCRQCTFTLAYIDHKSPKPDVLLNVLIKPISWVERMAGLQCKSAWGTLLRKKTVVILSSTQSTVGTSIQHTHSLHQASPRCVSCSDLFPPRERNWTNREVEKRKMSFIFHRRSSRPEQTTLGALQGTLVL